MTPGAPQVIYVGNYIVEYYWSQQLHRSAGWWAEGGGLVFCGSIKKSESERNENGKKQFLLRRSLDTPGDSKGSTLYL